MKTILFLGTLADTVPDKPPVIFVIIFLVGLFLVFVVVVYFLNKCFPTSKKQKEKQISQKYWTQERYQEYLKMQKQDPQKYGYT